MRKYYQAVIMHLWTPTFILFGLSVIFYGALHYYASHALEQAEQTQKMNVVLFDRILALRMFLSGLFALLIGYIGVKLTGHVWPAMLVHTITVAGLLLIDLPFKIIIQHYDITFLILSAVAAATGISGGITLGIFWLRTRF